MQAKTRASQTFAEFGDVIIYRRRYRLYGPQDIQDVTDVRAGLPDHSSSRGLDFERGVVYEALYLQASDK